MNVAVELPEDIAQQLKSAWQDMPRRVLEAIAVEGYRSGALTRGQVQRLLNLSWWETEAFLVGTLGCVIFPPHRSDELLAISATKVVESAIFLATGSFCTALGQIIGSCGDCRLP